MSKKTVSVVVPAKNEASNLERWLPDLIKLGLHDELIVIDDGSDDGTGDVAQKFGAKVIRNSISMGNGAAIKAGARVATTELVVFMDADGQHQPKDIALLLDALDAFDADMVVGARDGRGQATMARGLANRFYNYFATLVTGHKVNDLTSGFRVVYLNKFLQFLSLLPNGFSYPTTSTMAFFRSGYSVRYVSIDVLKRGGKSHLRPVRDGLRFLLIIFKVATLYSPLKVFVPIAAILFFLGLSRYVYTYLEMGTFTNMSALLMVSSVQVFLVGLVSEQITALMYKDK